MTNPSALIDSAEILSPTFACELTVDDQQWLTGFGVDSSWQNDTKLVNELNELIALGSFHLDEPDNEDKRQQVIIAREKFMDFVGIDQETLDTFRESHPTIIPLDTFIGTQRTMKELGLDAAKIINTQPSVINLAPESVQAKVANFTTLGLDAAKIINTNPTAINLAPESVQAKVRLLERTVKVLQWNYSAKELIEAFPAILGFNNDKLRILRRIAAENINLSGRTIEPRVLKSALINPLEKYILSLQDTRDTVSLDLVYLHRTAGRNNLSAPERKQKAKTRAETGSLGRIGAMYLKYAR